MKSISFKVPAISNGMKKAASIAILVAIFIFLFTPSLVSAQLVDTILEGNLVQCGGEGELPCNFCQLALLAERVLNFLVALTVVAATIMFTWAGILYATSGPNPGQIEKAHKVFWNVLIGLVAVLIAWLVVDTIMKTLVGDQRFGPWNTILCGATGGFFEPGGGFGPSPSPDQNTGGNGDNGGNLGIVTAGANTFPERQERNLFQSRGITVNNSNMCRECIVDPQQGMESECRDIRYQDYEAKYDGRRCTTVSNFRVDTYDAIYDVQEGSNCSLAITGGTELGHAEGIYSHRNGYKVDLEKSMCLDSYIKENFQEGFAVDGREGYVIDREIIPPGNAHIKIYAVDELTHWDVIVVEYNCLLEPLPGADRCFERKAP